MTYTKDIVRNLCNKNTPQALAQYMTKAQLVECYTTLYGITPRKSANSLDLAYSCYNFVQDEIRTADLTKLLR